MSLLTSLDFLTPGKAWPPPEERERLDLYRENRLLFEGRHELVFKDWIKLLRQDQQATLELVLNWQKRLSTLWADLLLGEPPRIVAGEKGSKEQETLDRLIRDNLLVSVAYQVALDVSRFGTGLFKVRYLGRGIIEGQQPERWFPVVRPDNIKEVVAHVLGYTYQEAGKSWLRVEIHEKGRITSIRYALKDDGTIGAETERTEQETGVDDFLVVPVHNVITTDRVTGCDDYSDLDPIIQELEVRIAQISRILDKHADPNMYGPDSAMQEDPNTGEWTVRGGGKYFPVGPDEEPPGYVTWDGQLEAAFRQIEVLMEQLYVISETCPAAFGQLKQGLAESGSALRRLLMVPLAKVNRIRMNFDPALKKVLSLAAALEVQNGMASAVRLENISITWKDGLPQDDREQAEIYTMLNERGLVSRETAIRHLFEFDPETLQKELATIATELAEEKPAFVRPNLPALNPQVGAGNAGEE